MINDLLIFFAGGLFGGLATFLLLRLQNSGRRKTESTTAAPLVPIEPQGTSDSTTPVNGEPGRLGDLHAQHLEAAANIREQRAASRAAREAQRIAAEEESRRDALRLEVENAERAEAQRIAAQAEAAREAQRMADEEAARRDALRLATENAERAEAQRIAAQAEAARKAQSIAAIEDARREVQRIAAAEKARQEAQHIAAEEEAALEAAREAERIAAVEQLQRQAQRSAADETVSGALAPGAAEEVAPDIAQAPVQPASPKPLSETLIMIVDDSKVGRIKTNRFLVNNQFQSQMAEDGCDALEKIKVRMPDVVITDVEMPNMDGFELTKHIRDNPLTAHIPVIIISGNSDGYEAKAKEVGADLILGKPYSETQMIEQIHEFLRIGRPASVT